MSQPDRSPRRTVPRRLAVVGGTFVLLAIAVVAVVAPASGENSAGLDLPGRMEAYIQAPIYARVPGYLKSWKHDIGGKVKAGDLLAEIATPDLDQQLMQARADFSVAQANAKLAQIGAERWQSLASTD